MRTRHAAVAAILASALAACAVPTPTPSASPSAEPTASAEPTPSATADATIPINVRFAGGLNCNIGFSYSCAPSLTVMEPDAVVPASFRRAATDPWWDPRAGTFQPVKASKCTLLGGTPAISPGRHLLVMSLIGSSDVASYNPDGTIATELLG